MLLLSVDTSGRQGSIALAGAVDGRGEDQQTQLNVMEVVSLEGGAFSAQLIPQISALLLRHSFNKSAVDVFVAATGPGSFTGLRVGLAAIKGLAEGLSKPIVPVSLLEAVAFASESQGKILALMDAGREDVYLGEYEIDGAVIKFIAERLLHREEFIAEIRGANAGASVVTPDKKLAQFSQSAGLPVISMQPVDAVVIARLGWKKFRLGETISPEGLEANYIRRTDAEIMVERRS